ncbi:MAG: lamin tail domain-containing protein, partial [Bacteroidales bacterium]|nr:lamin tail domain-containing protein [Bacteroidales bacterium]
MRLLIIPLFFLSFIGHCQINDDFSDGDFSQNPVWNGDQNRFQINNAFQLQLHDTAAGNAYLSIPYNISDSLEWHFSIRLAFSPSGSNNARVYLMSENGNLSENPNGYFLQFGEALSGDAIELFRQEGTEIESVCRGTNGKIASAFDIDIKVTYSTKAEWRIAVDWEKSGNFILECSGHSLSGIENPFFGFYCLYTKSNAAKFYFDDIRVDHIFIDNEAPKVDQIEVLDSRQLQIQFNEALDKASAEKHENYLIEQNNQAPITAIQNESNPLEVLLSFDQDIPPNQNLYLIISGIKDLNNNVIQQDKYDFYYSHAFYGDIVFNEIMADPAPVVGLPEVEYIELYNRTEYPIALSNWILKIGDEEKIFTEYTLKSHEYLLLGHSLKVDSLKNLGAVLGFSSFSLNNDEQKLSLISASEELIDEVFYSNRWYQ